MEYRYQTKIVIGGFDFGMVRTKNEAIITFPLHKDIENMLECLKQSGQKFELTTKYFMDRENMITGKISKYAIPLISFERIK